MHYREMLSRFRSSGIIMILVSLLTSPEPHRDNIRRCKFCNGNIFPAIKCPSFSLSGNSVIKKGNCETSGEINATCQIECEDNFKFETTQEGNVFTTRCQLNRATSIASWEPVRMPTCSGKITALGNISHLPYFYIQTSKISRYCLRTSLTNV